jgi:hypothetical protein
MVRIAVLPGPDGVAAAVRCLRAHVELPVVELRARLGDGRPVAEFSFRDPLADVRRCRTLLRAVAEVGAQVRIFSDMDGSGGREQSLENLHNWMRTLIGISRETRDQMYREADDET